MKQSRVKQRHQWAYRGLAIALSAFLFMGHAIQADASSPPDTVYEHIKALHNKIYDRDHVRLYIRTHFDSIVTDHDTALEAMIVAREYEEFDLALEIANQALRNELHSQRLYYEIGLVFLLKQQCYEASIIFRGILARVDLFAQGIEHDWIEKESREALKLCQGSSQWIYDYEFLFGFDNNLGNQAPAKSIRPEPDSVYDRYFKTLRQVIPNTPEEIVLGTKQKKGITSAFQHYLNRQYHFNGINYGIYISNKIGLTYPAGYEQIEASVGLSRTMSSNNLYFINHLSLRARKHELGKNAGGLNQERLRLVNSISVPGHYRPTFSVAIAKSRSKVITRRESNHIDLQAQLQHLPKVKGLPWFIEIGKRRNEFQNKIYSSKSQFYGFGINKLSINDLGQFTVRINREVSRPHIPRPWLRDRHKTTRDQFSVIYHGERSGRLFDVTVSWHVSSSRNQIEDYEQFNLSLRIK